MIPVAPAPHAAPDEMISQVLRQSIQIPPSVTKDGITSGFSTYTTRTSILPGRGTRTRELTLRDMYFMDEMTLIRGAFVGVAKTIAGLPWEIKGDDTQDPLYEDMARRQGWRLNRHDGVTYFQEVLRQANFGAGWGTFLSQIVLDYLRYDAGGYIEVIAAGESYNAPVGAISGIAHLDPIKTFPTGDPRYPAIYYDRWGGLHVLNHARVIRLVDMDDGDELRPGYGDSALSRAIAIAMRQVWETRYINTRLDDQPPPGLTVLGGITKAEWAAEQAKFRNQQSTDGKPVYGQRQFYHTADPAIMPKIESYEFSAPPEKFDYRTYVDIDVDMLALAMGVDRQELMQLSGGGAIGSQGQSMVLAQKSRGKTIGFLLQQLERKINDLLPDAYTFEFKVRDTQEALEEAQKAEKWAGVAEKLVSSGVLTTQQAQALVAGEVEAVQDAITDAPRVNDVDAQPVVAQDDTAGATPVASSAPPPAEVTAAAQKSYDVTLSGFIQDVAGILSSASAPTALIRLDRRGFNITMRSILKRYGYQAYKDGLAAGGVSVDTLDPDENADYMTIFVDQAQYIPGLSGDVYVKKTITPGNAYSRAEMWGKSLQAFNDAGMMAANQNGMYIWTRNHLIESCDDCIRLEGQVHRIRNWKARGLTPRSSKLKCWGGHCGCRLKRTTERARGRF